MKNNICIENRKYETEDILRIVLATRKMDSGQDYQLFKNLDLWLILPAGIVEESDIMPQIALPTKQEVMQ